VALPNDIAGGKTPNLIETAATSSTALEIRLPGELDNLGRLDEVIAAPDTGVAGHAAGVFARADSNNPTASDELGGIDSFSLSSSAEVLDSSDFADTSGARTRLLSLSDGTITIDGWVLFDDAPQESIRGAATTGVSVWITARLQPAGNNLARGFRVECKVDGFVIDAQVDGAVAFGASLVFNGKPVND
jgi:hypothetical protein